MKAKTFKHRRSRSAAVAEVVRRLLANALARDIQDPRLQQLTISEVTLSPDLRHATVYVLGAPVARSVEVQAGLESSRPFLRSLLAERGGLRYVPTLKFVLDDTADRAERIERLLSDAMPPTS